MGNTLRMFVNMAAGLGGKISVGERCFITSSLKPEGCEEVYFFHALNNSIDLLTFMPPISNFCLHLLILHSEITLSVLVYFTPHDARAKLQAPGLCLRVL